MRSRGVSGASAAKTRPAQPAGRFAKRAAIPEAFRNCRRESPGRVLVAPGSFMRGNVLLSQPARPSPTAGRGLVRRKEASGVPAPTRATNVLSKTLRYQVIFLSALSHPQERGFSGCCPGNTKSSRVLGEQQPGTTANALQTTVPLNRLTRDPGIDHAVRGESHHRTPAALPTHCCLPALLIITPSLS